MRDMHASAYAIALIVFAALERRLALEPGWFDRAFGPRLDLHSQWHVKRYRPETVSPHAVSLPGASALSPTSDEKPQHVLLPVHTDPSLISVVLHDAPGVADGAAGLQTLAAGGAGGGPGPPRTATASPSSSSGASWTESRADASPRRGTGSRWRTWRR